MAPRAGFALAFSAALALAVVTQAKSFSLEAAELEGLLGSDDACATDDLHAEAQAVDCALRAQQIKAELQQLNESAAAEGVQQLEAARDAEGSTGPCGGLVDKAIAKDAGAQACLYKCRSLCAPLTLVAQTYIKPGGKKKVQGMKWMICAKRYKSAFMCSVQAGNICTRFANMAKARGLNLPASEEEYTKQCGA